MASDDFSIKTKITLDTKNYEAGIKKAESATQKFSSSLSGVTKLLKSTFALAGISVGTKAIVNFGKEAVKSAESANKTLNILNNTLKVTGASAWTTSEELVKMSEEIAYSTNYTAGEIQDMQSVLLGFKNITGDTFREASNAITDMATVMGMDLKSAVQTVGKALDDPIKGLDSLRRQGFAFTDEQKEQLKQLVENGEQLKAQKIILDELNTTYGGAAKAAQSSFDKQRDAVDEFKETLGNQLIPVLDVFAEKSATSFSTLTEKIKTIDFSEIAGTVEYSVQVITEYFGVFYNNAKELVKGLAERFGDIEISLDTVKDAVYNSLNDIYKQMQISFGFMKALINGDWKLAWEYAKIYVLNVCKKILDGLDDLLKKMPDLVNGAIKGLNAYYEAQDKVLIEWFHLPEKFFKAPRLGTYDGKHFIDTTELQKQIDEATRIIEEATGKQVTISLTGLEQIDTNRKKYQKKAEAGEIQLTKTTEIEVKKRTTTTEKILENFIDSIKKKVADKEGFYSGLFENITSAFTEMFSMLGENLVGAGHSFEDFASVALNALSEVLKSISAQLSAIAVLKFVTHDYANATIALAGATASMVASGVASQVSKSLTTTKEKIDAIGDSANKAGKDLEYFIKRLEEIKSGMTASSRNLIANLTEARKAWIEAKEERNKAYDELNAMSSGDRHWWTGYVWKETDAYKNALNKIDQLEKKVGEFYKLYTDGAKDVLNQIKEEVEGNKILISSYDEMYQSLAKYRVAQVQWLLKTPEQQKEDKTDYTVRRIFGGDVTKTLYGQLQQYKTYVDILINEQKISIQKMYSEIYDTINQSGKTIGEKITNSIINGAEKTDFLRDMKSFIRENLIKLAVYTEEFQDSLATVGVELASALTGSYPLQLVREDLEKLYNSATKNAEKAESLIADIFGDIQDTVKETVKSTNNGLGDTLSSFEKLLESFKDSIVDMGGEIGQTFVDAIASGMNQSDFLGKMKDWIKRMLVQSVVYTESMKSEIEAIGQAITKGIREGFTETSLHEIRRDLSWVFNEANETVASLDNILDRTFSGYATGTNNALSGLHLVGEAGPELVRFRGGEQVLNAGNTQKALEGMGGTTINQNVTFNNLQDTTAYAMMNQFKQYNRQMAINSII